MKSTAIDPVFAGHMPLQKRGRAEIAVSRDLIPEMIPEMFVWSPPSVFGTFRQYQVY